ncbi:MAG: DNA repair protein RecO, partial [Halioglobus sp.]|nr:DNA repair protein RecO [Halioglobus sp.]
MRVSLQPSYVLHTRPYRDSSVVLEVFTAQYGRLSLVVRGVRRKARGGSNSALLQPFNPLLLSFSGRAEMKNLNAVEPAAPALALRDERLFSGLYINELLLRLLHRHDACPALFARYGQTLQALAGREVVDVALRRFELELLRELGYRLELQLDGYSGDMIVPDGRHRLQPGAGLVAWAD